MLIGWRSVKDCIRNYRVNWDLCVINTTFPNQFSQAQLSCSCDTFFLQVNKDYKVSFSAFTCTTEPRGQERKIWSEIKPNFPLSDPVCTVQTILGERDPCIR
jgi:hypothetical protein